MTSFILIVLLHAIDLFINSFISLFTKKIFIAVYHALDTILGKRDTIITNLFAIC